MDIRAEILKDAAQKSVRGLERICADAANRGMDVHVGPGRSSTREGSDRYIMDYSFDYIVHEPGSSRTPDGWTTYHSSALQGHPLVAEILGLAA